MSIYLFVLFCFFAKEKTLLYNSWRVVQEPFLYGAQLLAITVQVVLVNAAAPFSRWGNQLFCVLCVSFFLLSSPPPPLFSATLWPIYGYLLCFAVYSFVFAYILGDPHWLVHLAKIIDRECGRSLNRNPKRNGLKKRGRYWKLFRLDEVTCHTEASGRLCKVLDSFRPYFRTCSTSKGVQEKRERTETVARTACQWNTTSKDNGKYFVLFFFFNGANRIDVVCRRLRVSRSRRVSIFFFSDAISLENFSCLVITSFCTLHFPLAFNKIFMYLFILLLLFFK